ncbi:aminotransferase class V-fold PLP-dependent enzyme [Rhodocytophaga aerolata]|uniref:Aminotransferase class V-fold PLP-dependent enzyme n=1 Tax=Rhodocytophaga aerolata TaxID=455078 RepID=A0ABT8R1D3_9BACT|nr:aminotransferase class V-fold PLP-dependent enzyme [Rhodocytophaga aerolata]MDO1445466.1 aminotransferase class V-fold PLP-dependent enzyme [Rhodocytophaga aerolata]
MANWTSQWKQFLHTHPSLNIKPEIPSLHVPAGSAKILATDEAFWQQIKSTYPTSEGLINLNSGAVSSSPHLVEKAFLTYYQTANRIPSYQIFKYMEQGRELIREGLASLLNCSAEEVTMLRNTTEALNNVIFGLELKEDDEVVACKQDYSKAVASWKQRELRDKINVRWVNLEGPAQTDEEVIASYVALFSEKTKVLHLTHVINWNGQILPVKRLIEEAKARNIEVVLDGAHSFGLLETDMAQLGCDYFAAASHKWLSGPIPGGVLYVNKQKIAKLWPLASGANPLSDNIRKFEELSIQLMPAILALGYAIEYYLWLGRENKEQRLRYLRQYWTTQLQELENIRFHTPLVENRCCVIVNMALADWQPAALEKRLFENSRIHITAVTWENMQGIRVTPNVYTGLEELKQFVEAIKQLC